MTADEMLALVDSHSEAATAPEFAKHADLTAKQARALLEELAADGRVRTYHHQRVKYYERNPRPLAPNVAGPAYQANIFGSELKRDVFSHWDLAMAGRR